MQYVHVDEAKTMGGLRLVLSQGVPGPWGEAAKNIFKHKNIAYTPVAQFPARENHELKAWTGIRNAPIAILDDQPPKSNWADILAMAERIAPKPSLLPEKSEDRILALGISAEICGEGGFAWSSRVIAMADYSPELPQTHIMRGAYDAPPNVAAKAPQRVVDILTMLARKLEAQKRLGSPYLVGERLLACDIYWACFSQIIAPLPHERCPRPGWLRKAYANPPKTTSDALDPILLQHRDFVFEKHLGWPMEF